MKLGHWHHPGSTNRHYWWRRQRWMEVTWHVPSFLSHFGWSVEAFSPLSLQTCIPVRAVQSWARFTKSSERRRRGSRVQNSSTRPDSLNPDNRWVTSNFSSHQLPVRIFTLLIWFCNIWWKIFAYSAHSFTLLSESFKNGLYFSLFHYICTCFCVFCATASQLLKCIKQDFSRTNIMLHSCSL